MKFRITKPNVKTLCEAKGWKEFYGNNASIAADIIEEILKDPAKYDLTPEEIDQLNIAYNILFDCAPHVQESLKEKFLKEGYNEEEDWDDDFDESLKEAKDVNLSNRGNSISSLLLAHKEEIDNATSQRELIKVCKDILSERGGNKAQQFIAVLNSKKNHPAALQYVYDFILAGEGMRSPDSQRKTKPAHMKEALEEDFSSEQELIDAGFEQAGYRKNYDFYRKLINGKGKWYAVDTKDGRVFPITWDQAVGYEPIDSTEGMAMKLGGMLLPH